jgi:hypothetical protein
MIKMFAYLASDHYMGWSCRELRGHKDNYIYILQLYLNGSPDAPIAQVKYGYSDHHTFMVASQYVSYHKLDTTSY